MPPHPTPTPPLPTPTRPLAWTLISTLALILALTLVGGACASDDATGRADAETSGDGQPSSPPADGETGSPEPAQGPDGGDGDTGSSGTNPAATAPTPATVPTPPDGEIVEVFFSVGDGSDCTLVSGWARPAQRTPTVPTSVAAAGPGSALAELVAGPDADEQASGASSFFSPATEGAVHSVYLVDGLLVVNLNDVRSIIPNASTSCGSAALRAQLDTTAFAYPDVERIRYQINGSCDTFHHWLQTECHDVTPGGGQEARAVDQRASWSGCIPPPGSLSDGRWFGYVTGADATSVSFDLACWFSGQAAIEAAAEDGEESPPPNDYHVRNAVDRIRTVGVAAGTRVTWLPSGDPASAAVVDYPDWLAAWDDYQPGVWLTVVDGAVIEITEQYVP